MPALISTTYFGEQRIDYWEYVVTLLYFVVMYVLFSRTRGLKSSSPEYRYYLPALFTKMGASVFFTLIYFYKYGGGDSAAYYYSALAMRNMALEDPLEYIRQMFGDNSMEAWLRYTVFTGKPYQFMFFDDRTFAVIRVTSLVAFFTMKSFLLANVLMAVASFFGVWACYRTFVSYFPQLMGPLATGFLFMPSSVFWGSAVLKDTITFSAVCWWVYAVDEVFFKKRSIFKNSMVLLLSAMAMLLVKPYIFMVLVAATILWLFYHRLAAVRNLLFKFVLFPITMVLFVVVTLFILNRLGDSLGHFKLEGALKSIEVTQKDLVRSEAYGANSFDVGEFDGTWAGMLSKFPVAVNAALFRPYLWECNNITMLLSGLENTWVLFFAIFTLIRVGPLFLLRCVAGIPLLTMSMTFALLFAFVVGVSTPNFGALVRFKIPMVPFFISSLYIVVYLSRMKWALKKDRLGFDLEEFRMGTAHVGSISDLVQQRLKAKARRRSMSSPG